jgi:hypothetical protein
VFEPVKTCHASDRTVAVSSDARKVKQKVNLVIDREDAWGFEASRLPHYLESRLHMLVKLSALRTGRPIHPGTFLVIISVIQAESSAGA